MKVTECAVQIRLILVKNTLLKKKLLFIDTDIYL